jgi:predicted metal-dependent phosphoesterase TrpH
MGAPTFDLQSHSTYSDGELSPADTVRAAYRSGVEVLALTDHDGVGGVEQATESARALGVKLIPAVEISTIDFVEEDGTPVLTRDLHICGYGIDPANQALREQLKRSRTDRQRRSDAMAEALIELGWHLDERVLEKQHAGGGSVGRPHLALAVVAHSGNVERLARERLTDPTEFLLAYLTEGRPAFRPRYAPSVGEAIALIHEAGGLAVWAHPFFDLGAEEVVRDSADRFRAIGLDGIEAFYVTHTRAQAEMVADYCTRYQLLSTGSSDFHGPTHSRFNRFRAFDTYGLEPHLGSLLA